ncbi:phenylalanine--tRNA ligase subunit beta [Desulfobacter hydrogenophilus]|uniref:Phenylalanine--tRNA ligase beta subunit n=1 Tax=Desulfobacter hydrogenophilus TaxID=2291 RepID=A0A328FG94_9BACT|nr:phenylalanine--tRNA ligase subunit beta [Desulfobacter hydrogenophilus]NDY71972.1 phenylalanine--tRNA ligase subunit beta [Desulfobacter hydrogenophilus]QBH12336.1 phenylalanine--tRNA ligase subunit beta [Desulfobacter hydrogenophilus]RAM02063.1 phenylalanine--tRNA ligase subunit beta [Desulfobacter hydrogenophilus]
MKVSLSWLREYIPIDLDPQEISDRLTMAGLEVDGVESLYDYLDNVVVGQVVQARQHPNADKLTCCAVDIGKEEPSFIVCGAPNVREGMYVACALPGAVLPGDFKIKKSKLRGEPSHGMLCSAAELMLADDASGIMDLEGQFVSGTPLASALNLDDAVFEIDLTPNRPDCLSLIGVAREIGAFTEPQNKVTLPDVAFPEAHMDSRNIHDFVTVEIEDPKLCPRYTAGMLFDVTVGPSPLWLKRRLEAVGLSSVNNVVDITNFVMMETGQPLHAFDYDNIAKNKIIVRTAGKTGDEALEFTTLDSKVHKLDPEMLMICDGEKPVGIAGVMGGENSEITDATTRVLVESAYFNPVSIRRTAKRTGISSDASHRFERGVDPEGTMFALKRAVSLMAQFCSATIAKEIIDENPVKAQPVTIDLSPEALNVRLGTSFSPDEMTRILASVAFDVDKKDDGGLRVHVPSFRVDVARPEDLSEEVARLWGYNKIETSYPLVKAQGRPLAGRLVLRGKIRQAMTGFGFCEAINYNFIRKDACERMGIEGPDKRTQMVEILNPISDQMAVLRTSIVPGLLESMARNTAKQVDTLQLFEIGKIFYDKAPGEQPEEVEVLGGLITGYRCDQTWYSKKEAVDFFDLKGVVQGLLDSLQIFNVIYERTDAGICPYFEPGYGARVVKDGLILGTLGKIASDVGAAFGLKQDAYLFDLDMESLEKALPQAIQAVELPKFPSISRDMTFIVSKHIEVGAMMDTISTFAQKQGLIEDYFLFDVFEGRNIGEDKKSLSFRIIYRSASKTLTEKNIKKIHDQLSQKLIDDFKAGLPG